MHGAVFCVFFVKIITMQQQMSSNVSWLQAALLFLHYMRWGKKVSASNPHPASLCSPSRLRILRAISPKKKDDCATKDDIDISRYVFVCFNSQFVTSFLENERSQDELAGEEGKKKTLPISRASRFKNHHCVLFL